MAKESQRLDWIDYTRAICILAVFFLHTGGYYGLEIGVVNVIFYPIYVNAFFIVSGYLFISKMLSTPAVEKSIKSFLTTDAKTSFTNIVFKLVFPSIIFSILEFLPSSIINGRTISLEATLVKTLGRLSEN